MNTVVLLEARFQPGEDGDRLRDRRLGYIYFLETSRKCMIFLKNTAVLCVRRRADAANLAIRKHGLDQVARVHDATGCRTCADDRVDLVDEQDGARVLPNFRDDPLQALLEIAAVLRTRDQRAHVERVNRAVLQDFRHALLDDHAGQPFRESRLADAGLADVQRVVLAAPAQDLDRALDLDFAPDQRVDLAVDRTLIEIRRVLLER